MTQPFSVRECLRAYTAEALGEICANWDLASQSKDGRLRAAEKILQDPLHVRERVEALEPDMIRLLHLASKHETVSASDLYQVPGLYSLKAAPMTVSDAASFGFLLVCPHERAGSFSFSQLTRDRIIGDSSLRLFVPKLVQKYLPDAPPLGVKVPVAEAPEDDQITPSSDRATMLFLETLRIVEMVSPRVTAAGTIHKSDEVRAREISRDAGLPNDGLSFALMVTEELGAIEAKQGRLVTTAKAAQWTQLPRADRMRDVFNAYLTASPLPDVKLFFPQLFKALEEHLEADTFRRSYHRNLVAAILREQPEGVWHSVNAFAHTVYQIDRNLFFLEERWRAIHANVREATSAWKEHQWQMREKRLLLWMIQNLLNDMGMVELADEGDHFRVTPIGRYALGVGPKPKTDFDIMSDALIVQPDFEIVAFLDRCTPELRRMLDTYCDRVRSGEASTYRLTQESVYRGIRSGTSVEVFLDYLKKSAKNDIPANVLEQFNSWNRKVESILIRTRCQIVEYPTPEEAKEASSLDGARLIGDRFVCFESEIPEVDSTINYRRAQRRCLLQEEDLTLSLPWNRADLFIAKRLCEMGDLKKDNGLYRLELSKNKLKNKDDWTFYAAQLEALTEQPLAARFRVALRAWSGDLGGAHSGTATIVRFDAPELCEAAMEFPEVQDFIEGRLGLFALVIHQGKLAKFKKALRLRGIIVQNDGDVADAEGPEQWAEQLIDAFGAEAEAAAHTFTEDAEDDADDEDEIAGLPSYSPRIVREIIEDAIARRRPLLIEYQSAYSDRPSIRQVDPVTLDVSGITPSLSGYCHHHGGPRTFKLSRVTGIRVLEDESF